MSYRKATLGCLALMLLLAQMSWGRGEGLFQSPQSYNSGVGGAFSIAVGDVNGDGKADLVVANFCNGCSGGVVGVLLGRGDGTFQTPQTYDSGGWGASSIALADVNGDGRLDVVVGNSAFVYVEASIGVLLGNGDGTFQAVRTYPSGGGHPTMEFGSWIAVSDVNGDGRLDVLVANECLVLDCQPPDGGVGVLLGNGDGTFQAVQSYSSGGWYADSIAVADVNKDGNPDLLVTDRCVPNKCDTSGSVVSVLLGNGNGSFMPAQNYYSGGKDPLSVAVADVNGDGKLDLLVANECRGDRRTCGQTGFAGVLLGNGDGTFQAAQSYNSGGNSARSIAVADINQDGHLDLLIANYCQGPISKCFEDPNGHPSVVGVLLGNGDGTFQPPQTYKSGSAGAVSITMRDVNGDGGPDLLVANSGVIVLLGRFSTTTTLTSSLNPSVYGQSVAFAATVVSDSAIPPSGTVAFRDGSNGLGTVTLSGGVATLTKKGLAVGSHSITAKYNGAPAFLKSTSPAVVQVVSPNTMKKIK